MFNMIFRNKVHDNPNIFFPVFVGQRRENVTIFIEERESLIKTNSNYEKDLS
jgi:hypothetical protein